MIRGDDLIQFSHRFDFGMEAWRRIGINSTFPARAMHFMCIPALFLLDSHNKRIMCLNQMMGFCGNRGTGDAIFVARRLMEHAWATHDGTLLLLSLDWARASDSNSHSYVLIFETKPLCQTFGTSADCLPEFEWDVFASCTGCMEE